jgi:hypothetical protein
MTKMANTWPDELPHCSANAIRLMFTAFRISSIDRKMTITFRRVRTPNTPIMNSAADSTR